MQYTRKNRRGGGMFNFLSTAPTPSPTSTLNAKLKYNLTHSKSKVANVLRKPGQVTYTNKERIRSEYQKAIAQLRALEKPVESATALGSLASKLSSALNSAEARETGAVVITIPVGAAQLMLKALRVFIAALVMIFWDIPTFAQLPLSPYVLPNSTFNTTKNVYAAARRATGANTGSRNVKNYL